MNPRILFITGHQSRKLGGLEEYLLQLNAEFGRELMVVENNYAAIPAEVRERFEAAGLNIHRGRVRTGPLGALIDIQKILAACRPAIVHVNFSPVSYISILLCRLMGINNVFWTRHSMLNIKKHSRSWWYHRICLPWVRKKICVSESIERELAGLGLGDGRRISLPLGINLDRFDPGRFGEAERSELRNSLGLGVNDFVISVVAQVRPVKRLDVLIEAVNILVHEHRLDRVRLLVIGGTFPDRESRELEKKLRQRLEDCRLTGRVQLLEARNDIDRIYAISDLSGLTSASEGLPLSLAEAAAMGLPLFGSRAGGIPEIVRPDENGFLFETGDYRALAEIIKQLIEDEQIRRRFSGNSRRLARDKYSLVDNVKTLREIYPASALST